MAKKTAEPEPEPSPSPTLESNRPKMPTSFTQADLAAYFHAVVLFLVDEGVRYTEIAFRPGTVGSTERLLEVGKANIEAAAAVATIAERLGVLPEPKPGTVETS